MFNIFEWAGECITTAVRTTEQIIYEIACEEYAYGGNRTKCYKCKYETCHRHIEAKIQMSRLQEEYSASGQQSRR